MDMKWTNHVLPGDIYCTAKEIDAAGDSMVKAIEHLLGALQYHDRSDFAETRWNVAMALERLEDWKRSDREMYAAYKRFEEEERLRKRTRLIVELQSQGVNVVMLQRKVAK